jgi:hypothetical protein
MELLVQRVRPRTVVPSLREQASSIAGLHNFNSFQRRDANKFYWKSRPPKRIPVTKFIYECEQWRHGNEPKPFCGHISFDPDEGEISGALECEVHAENLTTAAKLLIPVRLTIKKKSVLELVGDKINYLFKIRGR